MQDSDANPAAGSSHDSIPISSGSLADTSNDLAANNAAYGGAQPKTYKHKHSKSKDNTYHRKHSSDKSNVERQESDKHDSYRNEPYRQRPTRHDSRASRPQTQHHRPPFRGLGYYRSSYRGQPTGYDRSCDISHESHHP